MFKYQHDTEIHSGFKPTIKPTLLQNKRDNIAHRGLFDDITSKVSKSNAEIGAHTKLSMAEQMEVLT